MYNEAAADGMTRVSQGSHAWFLLFFFFLTFKKLKHNFYKYNRFTFTGKTLSVRSLVPEGQEEWEPCFISSDAITANTSFDSAITGHTHASAT